MQYRTDLAMERAADHPDIPGVQVINAQAGDCARCEVRIESEEAARQLQKPCGRYITFEIPPLHQMAQPARAGWRRPLRIRCKACCRLMAMC